MRSRVLMRWSFLVRDYKRKRGHMPSAPIYALLGGNAKRLATAEAAGMDWSRWGRSMLAKRGGYAVQRKFRAEGRNVGAYAARISLQKRAATKRARQPGFARSWFTNLDGI